MCSAWRVYQRIIIVKGRLQGLWGHRGVLGVWYGAVGWRGREADGRGAARSAGWCTPDGCRCLGRTDKRRCITPRSVVTRKWSGCCWMRERIRRRRTRSRGQGGRVGAGVGAGSGVKDMLCLMFSE